MSCFSTSFKTSSIILKSLVYDLDWKQIQSFLVYIPIIGWRRNNDTIWNWRSIYIRFHLVNLFCLNGIQHLVWIRWHSAIPIDYCKENVKEKLLINAFVVVDWNQITDQLNKFSKGERSHENYDDTLKRKFYCAVKAKSRKTFLAIFRSIRQILEAH